MKQTNKQSMIQWLFLLILNSLSNFNLKLFYLKLDKCHDWWWLNLPFHPLVVTGGYCALGPTGVAGLNDFQVTHAGHGQGFQIPSDCCILNSFQVLTRSHFLNEPPFLWRDACPHKTHKWTTRRNSGYKSHTITKRTQAWSEVFAGSKSTLSVSETRSEAVAEVSLCCRQDDSVWLAGTVSQQCKTDYNRVPLAAYSPDISGQTGDAVSHLPVLFVCTPHAVNRPQRAHTHKHIKGR